MDYRKSFQAHIDILYLEEEGEQTFESLLTQCANVAAKHGSWVGQIRIRGKGNELRWSTGHDDSILSRRIALSFRRGVCTSSRSSSTGLHLLVDDGSYPDPAYPQDADCPSDGNSLSKLAAREG